MIEKYRINGDGTIDLHHILEPEGQMPALLPRIGLTMTLCDDMQQVKWYGRGPEENYPDRKTGYAIGVYEKTVDDMFEPHLRYIGVLATGYNVVDIEAAHERGIIVTNVPAYSTESVAQMVFAHLLTVTNRTEHYAILNRNGRWSTNPDFCYWDTEMTELAGKTFGIVGLGNIGSRVAQIALAFGMKVKALTSKNADALPTGIEKASLEDLLATSDVVSLHCPLTEKTRQMINGETLRLMKSTAILINTGRGPLVDDQAIAEALEEKRLTAFCADVLTEEPPKADHPLLKQPNAFITPHIAWATKEARGRLIQVATDNVRSFLSGQAINMV